MLGEFWFVFTGSTRSVTAFQLPSNSVLDCLNTKLPKSLKVFFHGFEFVGGVPLPIRDLARSSKRIPRAV
jgi:hypothetical protein